MCIWKSWVFVCASLYEENEEGRTGASCGQKKEGRKGHHGKELWPECAADGLCSVSWDVMPEVNNELERRKQVNRKTEVDMCKSAIIKTKKVQYLLGQLRLLCCYKCCDLKQWAEIQVEESYKERKCLTVDSMEHGDCVACKMEGMEARVWLFFKEAGKKKYFDCSANCVREELTVKISFHKSFMCYI